MTNRTKLPDTRSGVTQKFSVENTKGYLTLNFYEDGEPGEIFIKIAKEGSTMRGFTDSFATSISIGLQYGVPLSTFSDKFQGISFPPNGYIQTGNKDLDGKYYSSLYDFIFQWINHQTEKRKKVLDKTFIK